MLAYTRNLVKILIMIQTTLGLPNDFVYIAKLLVSYETSDVFLRNWLRNYKLTIICYLHFVTLHYYLRDLHHE